MAVEQQNPYASPEPLTHRPGDSPDELANSSSTNGTNPWKEIAARWERLRIWYNAILLLCGLSGFVFDPFGFIQGAELALVYAVMANLCYFAGPLCEMYLNWIVDIFSTLLPTGIVSIVRAPVITWILFTLGTSGAALLTFALSIATSLFGP
ncbi:MAG: hypothetical protein AB7U73_01805 [Pirellulales bacterium]